MATTRSIKTLALLAVLGLGGQTATQAWAQDARAAVADAPATAESDTVFAAVGQPVVWVTLDEAAQALAQHAAFFEHLQPNEMIAFDHRQAAESGDADATLDGHLKLWQAALVEPTAAHRQVVSKVAKEAQAWWAWRFPSLDNVPMKLAILDETVCGFPHTHGAVVFLPKGMLDRLVNAPAPMDQWPKEALGGLIGLMVHEQMHVLQRTLPDAWPDLYANWGFVHAPTLPWTPVPSRQLSNPDGPDTRWLWPIPDHESTVGGTQGWAGLWVRPTLLLTAEPREGDRYQFPRDMGPHALFYQWQADREEPWARLAFDGEGVWQTMASAKADEAVVGSVWPLAEVGPFVNRFGRMGYHPNEILANWIGRWAQMDWQAMVGPASTGVLPSDAAIIGGLQPMPEAKAVVQAFVEHMQTRFGPVAE